MRHIREFLGLERNILVMLGTVFFLGFGEELWARFMPKYLEFLGAGTMTIAMYGTLKDLLDALSQYPGGWLTDRLGRRAALMAFSLIAIAGYIIYLFSSTWEWIIFGTLFAAAWGSHTSPAIFAIIGDTLSSNRRSIGFGVQSILKRIPVMFAPLCGGWLIALVGLAWGLKIGFLVSILLGIFSILIVKRYYISPLLQAHERLRFRDMWRQLHPRLRRLLLADCFARWAEGIPEVFIILYAVNIIGLSSFEFGSLTSISMLTAILTYIPIAKISDRVNRKPFVLLTFAFFALYPLAVVLSKNFIFLILAFVIGGLREIGEPARKAMIVDLANEKARGRTVGFYYLIRGVVVFPAALIGGWLWTMNYKFPFYAAGGAGIVGLLAFAVWGSDDRVESQSATTKGAI